MTKLVDDCPRCGAGHITFNLLNATSVLRNGQHVLEAFCVCQHCRQATIFELIPLREVDLSSIDGSVNNYVQILGYISIADFNARSSPAHLPSPIAAAFEEGAKCVAVGCFNAAAAMFRLSLDLATKELLPTDKTQGPNEHITRRLALRLQWLFDNGMLPEPLRDLSLVVKDEGNAGAHDGTLDAADADDLIDFTERLLTRLYTEPEAIRLAHERIADRKAKRTQPTT